jgi:hypothetical protein
MAEWIAWTPMLILILILGIYPNLLFKVTDVAVHPMTVAIGKAIGA